MITTQDKLKMSRGELTKLIDQKYQRRAFIPSDIKDYVCSLSPEKAFALSRLLPQEVLSRLLSTRGTDSFANNIIEYAQRISVDGKLNEVVAQQTEELFIVTHTAELLKELGGSLT